MFFLSLSLLLAPGTDGPGDALSKRMLPIYVREAEAYSIAVDSAADKPLALKKEPVFEWSNPARGGGQQGAVFVWLRDGRPAALGCFFSQPHPKLPGRQVMHELHALDPEKLVVKRDEVNKWDPQAGLARTEADGAGVPAAAPGARLLQMRKLAQEFAGYSIDRDKKRWDLRLLPQPIYRYPSAKTGVLDGAIFALVSDAGTDPEVLLVVEAREEKGKVKWEYALGRFSDWELHVSRKDKGVWSSVRDEKASTFAHDALHLYRLYGDKVVATDGKVLARIRQTRDGQDITTLEEN